MALITVSGFPSAGKTRFAERLMASFEERLRDPTYHGPALELVRIEDDLGHLGREAYSESRLEKPVRASFLTTLNRRLAKKAVVIADGLNYIKGYRYQMNCAAKEAGVRYCTVHVAAPVAKVEEWNKARPDAGRYTESTLAALIMRYEEPSSMVRWDSPLFTVAWDDDAEALERIINDIWNAVTTGIIKKANPSVVPNGQTATDTIQALHSTTSAIISLILSHLSLSPLSPHLPLPTPYPARGIRLPPRALNLSELQRLKRQFESIQREGFKRGGQGVLRAGWGEGEWAEAWVKFLEGQWGTGD